MPELPEVEMVRRSLRRFRLKSPVVRVWRSRFNLRTGEAWTRRKERVRQLKGWRPGDVDRRGKYLLFNFYREDAEHGCLLIHLGMSGHVEVCGVEEALEDHTHLRVLFEDERELRFVDPRRFGGVRFDLRRRIEGSHPISALGPEPLDRGFDGEVLAARAAGSRRTIRDVLLDQRVVAGLGNIYVLEALYEAGIHPATKASRLQSTAWERIAAASRRALQRGIEHKGTTLRDYRDASGETGTHQDALRVYGRGGAPCLRCGAILDAWMMGGRTAVRCPKEQPTVRGRWVS
ncbi:MAG: bifunctional DNA-formamidopyrimidine glycosylase/DNA-(apurinic or apyrimidinic site) lyase [Nannocystaceae bacterium]